MIDAGLRSLLDEIFTTGRAFDAQEPEHARRWLNLEPDTAQLLSILLRAGGRRSVLEIGTSNGYSTIWLAWSIQQTGGRVVSVERDAAKLAEAEANLRRAGLRERVELVCGDATTVVASLAGPYDCIFFDADRRSAPEQLALLLPKLTADALILADNALSHPEEIASYLAAIEALPDADHLVVPVGKGLSVAYRGADRRRRGDGRRRAVMRQLSERKP